MAYIGKYGEYVHALSNERYIVGIRRISRGVSTRNPPRRDPPNRHRKVLPLEKALLASMFEELAETGAPTYANPNAAIKAARRVYPELQREHPWRPCRGRVL